MLLRKLTAVSAGIAQRRERSRPAPRRATRRSARPGRADLPVARVAMTLRGDRDVSGGSTVKIAMASSSIMPMPIDRRKSWRLKKRRSVASASAQCPLSYHCHNPRNAATSTVPVAIQLLGVPTTKHVMTLPESLGRGRNCNAAVSHKRDNNSARECQEFSPPRPAFEELRDVINTGPRASVASRPNRLCGRSRSSRRAAPQGARCRARMFATSRTFAFPARRESRCCRT